jgi:hypothetical protein
MVEQTIPQADLNPVRAAVLHRIAQSLARTADTNLFLREALGELSELLQLTFAIVTQRERLHRPAHTACARRDARNSGRADS